jgi:hypothetical protein
MPRAVSTLYSLYIRENNKDEKFSQSHAHLHTHTHTHIKNSKIRNPLCGAKLLQQTSWEQKGKKRFEEREQNA